MRILLVLLILTSSYTLSWADSTSNSLSLSLPNSSMGYQSDKFRAGELDCSNAIGSATQLEFGVTGLIQGGTSFTNGKKVGDIGVYSRIIIPLGKRVKSRINCNRLYELELQKKELEVMKLQQEINQLRSLAFENQEHSMAEVEIAGAKIKGGKMLLILPILGSLGGGLWGGFEFYKDYMDMKEIIQEIDTDAIQAKNILLESKLDDAIDYTRDIKNNLRQDIMSVEGHVDKIRGEVQNAIDEMNQLQKDTTASMREVESLNRETEKDVRDTMRETESRIEDAMTTLEERLGTRLQEALDNPLVGN